MKESYTIVQFAKKQLKDYILDQYIDLVDDKDDAQHCNTLAETEVSSLKPYKLFKKLLKHYFQKHGNYSFNLELDSLKTKVKRKAHKLDSDAKTIMLTSMEPNIILTFVCLGYLNYISEVRPKVVYQLSEVINKCLSMDVSYLNFSAKYCSKIRPLLCQYKLESKHVVKIPENNLKILGYLLGKSEDMNVRSYAVR